MMKRTYLFLLLIAVLLIAPGCYHAQVTTDKAPSSTVIDQPWAMSFVFGLVPPPVVETAQQCPNGLARVETRISFLNGLVAALSANIITPMHIRVTCAAGASARVMPRPDVDFDGITIPRAATEDGISRAFNMAAMKAMQTNEPVAVRFVK